MPCSELLELLRACHRKNTFYKVGQPSAACSGPPWGPFLKNHFLNIELQQKSNTIVQVPKPWGLPQPPNYMPPSSAFQTHSLAPSRPSTTFRKVRHLLWAHPVVTEKTPPQAFGHHFIKIRLIFVFSILSYFEVVLVPPL